MEHQLFHGLPYHRHPLIIKQIRKHAPEKDLRWVTKQNVRKMSHNNELDNLLSSSVNTWENQPRCILISQLKSVGFYSRLWKVLRNLMKPKVMQYPSYPASVPYKIWGSSISHFHLIASFHLTGRIEVA